MKRFLALALLICTVLSLTACSGTFTCDGCGDEVKGKKYKHTAFDGDLKLELCKDCHEELEEQKKEMEEELKDIRKGS